METTSVVGSADSLLRRGPFLSVLLQGLPLAIGLASHAVINLVDLALVGRLGDGAVQAVHVATTWNFLPMLLGNCVSTALLSRLSRRIGDGDRDGASALNRRAQWFMVWLGVGIGLASALPAAWQVDATGVAGRVRADALHYLVVSNLGCLPMFVLMQTTAAMRAAGEAMAPLTVLLIANLLNILFDLPLLYGWDAIGLPSIGPAGAAYASVAARLVASAASWWWLRRAGHPLSLRGPSVPLGEPVARPLLVDAWPQVLQIGLRAALVVVLTVVVQRRFGDAATVSLGVVTRLDTLVLFSALGFANAATAYAGRAVRVGRSAEARWAGGWAAAQAAAFGACFVWFYQREADWLLSWFRPRPTAELVELTRLYFTTAAWSQVLAAAALGAIGAIQGAGHMVRPLLCDLIGFTLAGLLLWRWCCWGQELDELYRTLCHGMAMVLLSQLALLVFGRWATDRGAPN